MRKYLALSLLCLTTTSAFAQTSSEKTDDGGYSYFTLGMENTTYKESYNNSRTSVNVTSPTINSGGLYVINDTWDFSIDALGTFSPNHVEEHWHNGQKNQFEYIKAATDVLLQYKITPQWRLIAGPSLSYQTYKRYGRDDKDNDTLFTGVWEEKTTAIFVNAGFAYNSGALINNKWHFYMTAKAGVPVYTKTENTKVLGAIFSPFGFRSAINGGISYQIMKGVNLGLYTQLSYEYRNEDGSKMYDTEEENGHTKGYFATLPKAEIINFSTGLQLLWKL